MSLPPVFPRGENQGPGGYRVRLATGGHGRLRSAQRCDDRGAREREGRLLGVRSEALLFVPLGGGGPLKRGGPLPRRCDGPPLGRTDEFRTRGPNPCARRGRRRPPPRWRPSGSHHWGLGRRGRCVHSTGGRRRAEERPGRRGSARLRVRTGSQGLARRLRRPRRRRCRCRPRAARRPSW